MGHICNLVPEFNGLVSKQGRHFADPFTLPPLKPNDTFSVACLSSSLSFNGQISFPLPTYLYLMSKTKTAFFCSNCGYESAKWTGKCPACNEWNTFVEEVLHKGEKPNTGWSDFNTDTRKGKTVLLNEVSSSEEERILTSDEELNRVLGGGIVPGSIVLVAVSYTHLTLPTKRIV